ncbi:uncharacterized protein PB18E9.04c-like [Portunus trituberculatus]|uniref:uncharacterized protein PB18E9.04c-like n=1 Tax=Portunus trituberculatus TaxID=210409 RepID=UPI001E1CD0E3|nr:uncharacterized protein PB18E9.04c-like [Portunus trituberculatus]
MGLELRIQLCSSKMAFSVVRVVILLGVFLGDCALSQELKYETHPPYVQPAVQTLTSTTTVTVTHTVRQIVTSGVSDEVITTYTPVVTSLVTEYTFTGIGEGADTAVVTSTSTPVVVVTSTRVTSPVRTFVSIFSTFATVTVTVDLVFSVTSEATRHTTQISPVYETRVLQHVVGTTTTLYSTFTTTLTTHERGYHN